MYYVTLKKIESKHKNLRSDIVNGVTPELPITGISFFMYSDDVLTDKANIRHITTSIVESVDNETTNDIIMFRTKNSIYELSNIRVINDAELEKINTVSN